MRENWFINYVFYLELELVLVHVDNSDRRRRDESLGNTRDSSWTLAERSRQFELSNDRTRTM